jgi:uncharacterized protein (TIGR00269 family)
VKCRVCRGRASVEVRRHNAAFCREHFVAHVTRQVERTIDEFDMFGPSERLLLGVSGGKDSLTLWEILTRLGYLVDGVYLELGIEGPDHYSSSSRQLAESFAKERDLSLQVVDMAGEYGFTIPQAAAATRRVACSVCGLSKRYALNKAALQGGYDVLVMGHNLDDEAATLFGNVLQWNIEYVARQRPVLPATAAGLVRKAKPLIRVAERETAAYAVLQGIDYEVDECPMVDGNTGIRLKEWLNVLEDRSPGTKQQFLFGFFERGAPLLPTAAEAGPPLKSCADCGQPTTGTVCAFCRLRALLIDE